MTDKPNFPWLRLKQAEMKLLEQFSDSQNADPILVEDLRRFLRVCSGDPDADEAICYHGALALLSEVEQDRAEAIRHRETEISKIERLHELAKENPGDRAALVYYEEEDLARRYDILGELKSKKRA